MSDHGCAHVRILGVASSMVYPRTASPFEQFTIDAEQIDGEKLMMQFYTSNAWRASMCQESPGPLWVSWKRNAFGNLITMVQRYRVIARKSA